jgi:hypothetical protein
MNNAVPNAAPLFEPSFRANNLEITSEGLRQRVGWISKA